MLNKHGLKIEGIKRASGNTVNYPSNMGLYTEIFYDKSTGEVWTVDQVSFSHQTWTEYNDPDVIKICETEKHLSMQEIADEIYQKYKIQEAIK